MKRYLIIVILLFITILHGYGLPELSGTWTLSYDYFIQYDSFYFVHEEKKSEPFQYMISPANKESQDKTISSIEFIDNELVKVTFQNEESKRYFYDLRPTNTAFAERVEGYYGLIFNKGEIVIGLKDTGNEKEYQFIYYAGYMMCVGRLIKQEE